MLPLELGAQGTDFFGTPRRRPEPPPPRPVVVPEPPPPAPQPEPQAPKPIPAEISISDVIFVLDTSGSMDARLEGQKVSRLEAAKNALLFFASNMKEGTRFQLWSFNARLKQHPNSPAVSSKEVVFEEIGPLGSPVRQHLQQEIQGLETRGGTNLYQALFEALRYFRSSSYQLPEKNVQRFKVIVLLADGQDDGTSPIQLTQVQQAAKQADDIAVKTIGFGVAPRSPVQQALCELATAPEDCLVTSTTAELQEIIRSFTRS